MIDNSRRSRLAFAAVSTLTVLTWYALPDAVRSRPARGIIKTGLLGVTGAGAAMVPRVFPVATAATAEPAVDLPKPVIAALAVGSTVAAGAATVWGEKLVFGFGERRRAAGVRCAHTPLALALALGTGALAAIDWEKIATRLADR